MFSQRQVYTGSETRTEGSRETAQVGFILAFLYIAASLLALMGAVLSSPFSVYAQSDPSAPYLVVNPTEGPLNSEFLIEIHVPLGRSTRVSYPTFAHSDEFDFRRIGVESRAVDRNGEVSAERIFVYRIIPSAGLAPGKHDLPNVLIVVDGNNYQLPAPTLNILSGSASGAAKPKGFDFTHLVSNLAPYVGEQVVYSTEVLTTMAFTRANLNDTSLPDFARESFGKFQEQRRDSGSSVHYTVREALFPLHSGEATIPPRQLTADIRVPREGGTRQRNPWDVFDEFLSDVDPFMPQQIVTRNFTAAPITLTVRELPPPPRGIELPVPVGDLAVDSSVDERSVEEGGSTTLTIDLISDGNLKTYELPQPAGPNVKDFKIYVDKPKVVLTPNQTRIMFKKIFTVTFVPQRSGSLALPTYAISSFNPKQGQYITAQTVAENIQVRPRKGGERLVVRGADIPKSGTGVEKQEITPLGEDLLPQHIGPATMTIPVGVPQWLRTVCALGLALGSLLIDRILRRRRNVDPHRVRAAAAFRDAENRLAAGDVPPPDVLLEILREYLGARFSVPSESLTSADVLRVLPATVAQSGVGKELVTVLRALQDVVYGGRPPSSSDLKLLHERVRECLRSVERAVPARKSRGGVR